ncbi:PCC domain-containing protein [Streptomyces sp. enrichment culture]|uniref:PCC domain-containing protein n=1 Tax=Streptomyces sp. enrichment culture TaxID=1795815 RepID=UPI003F55E9AA
MERQRVQASPAAVRVVVLDPGEEAVAALTDFARARSLRASRVTAVGAFSRAMAGWFDREAKDYPADTGG